MLDWQQLTLNEPTRECLLSSAKLIWFSILDMLPNSSSLGFVWDFFIFYLLLDPLEVCCWGCVFFQDT